MFRPCIDIHDGEVKQIVGASLTSSDDKIETNFKSERPSTYFAEMYKVSFLCLSIRPTSMSRKRNSRYSRGFLIFKGSSLTHTIITTHHIQHYTQTPHHTDHSITLTHSHQFMQIYLSQILISKRHALPVQCNPHCQK